jgi:HD superfamily phosphodiesterase
MDKMQQLTYKMIEHEKACPKRINHFLKVNSFAKIIADAENLDKRTKFIIDAATLLHDVGIKISLEKYNSSAGKHQEVEGPPIAQEILTEIGFEPNIMKRICFLIANHHSYTEDLGIDFQILIEADFLVNIFEDNLNKDTILKIKNDYFKTKSGTTILEQMYLS